MTKKIIVRYRLQRMEYPTMDAVNLHIRSGAFKIHHMLKQDWFDIPEGTEVDPKPNYKVIDIPSKFLYSDPIRTLAEQQVPEIMERAETNLFLNLKEVIEEDLSAKMGEKWEVELLRVTEL